MTTLARVYNEALRRLGERRLTATTETRDARYHLDDAYTEVVPYCLEQGLWNFAMRAVQIEPSDTISPQFGYSYAFEKPTDWLRTYILSENENLTEWILRLNDENAVWYADCGVLYARYVSNGTSYGLDLTKWPQTFADYVSARLALVAGPSICTVGKDKLDDLKLDEKRAKAEARNKDAMNEPPMFPPHGSWVRARRGQPNLPRNQRLGY